MKKENEKKKVILMIVGVIALLLVVVGATFAYFNAQIGKGENTKIEATTGTTDSLTFNITDIDVTDSDNKILDENNNEDANIVINASQENFAQNGNSLGDGVNLNAHLIANNTNSLTASYTYNIYLDISKNNLEYTSYMYEDKVISFKTQEEKDLGYIKVDDDYVIFSDLDPIPELVLVVQKPDGSYLDSIEKLEKDEITIEGKSVPCFDITEVKDFITITSEYQIEATEENKGIVDQNWQVRVIFKNLETDQHLNTDKSFKATLSIQSEKINYLDLASYAENCNITGYCNFTDYRSRNYRYSIKNVKIVNYIANEDELNSVDSWDLSSSKDRSIMGWLKENEDPEVPYDLYIGSNLKDDEKIVVKSFAHAFQDLSYIETIDLNPDILDTSNLTDTSYMFYYCMDLTTITGIEDLDVSNVIDMSGMFEETNNLVVELNLTQWKVSNVTNMRSMFENTGLVTIDLSNWDTHNVIDMTYMFKYTRNLTTLKVNNWDLSGTKLSDGYSGYGPFYQMFALSLGEDPENIMTIEGIETWKVSEVTNMSYMFADAYTITTLNLNNWEVSNVTNMSNMFDGASSLTTLDLSNWETQNVTDMSRMFSSTDNLITLKVNNWDLSGTRLYDGDENGPFSYMFQATGLTTIEGIETWKVSEVTNMSYMFIYASSLTKLNLSNWDTHNVTNMESMFEDANKLISIDMRSATFSQVTSYDYMFPYIDDIDKPDDYTALIVTITGDANKQWLLKNTYLTEDQLIVLSE